MLKLEERPLIRPRLGAETRVGRENLSGDRERGVVRETVGPNRAFGPAIFRPVFPFFSFFFASRPREFDTERRVACNLDHGVARFAQPVKTRRQRRDEPKTGVYVA